MTVLIAIGSLLVAAVTAVIAQQNGDVMLSGYKSSERFGRLDMFLNGQWGSVCNEGFDLMDANVACRQMGLGLAMDVVNADQRDRNFSRFGYLPQGTPIHVTVLQCNGTEKHLLNCPFSTNTGDCTPQEVVEMSCSNFRPQPNPGDVHLVGGLFPSHGILEIYNNGSWRRPCADGFGNNASAAVCTQLGYTDSVNYKLAAHSSLVNRSGSPNRNGLSISWKACPTSAICASSCISLSEGSCSDDKMIDITCSHSSTDFDVTMATSCTIENAVLDSFSLRLVNGTSPNQGRLEIYSRGWFTICGLDTEHFTSTSGHVACRLLGFAGLEAVHRMSQDIFGTTNATMGVHRMLCNGGEENLMQCRVEADSKPICTNTDAVGLTCSTDYGTPPYGAITLEGSGGASGRLSVYNGSVYGPVCDHNFSETEADVACRQLGYEGARALVRNSYFSFNSSAILSNISCSQKARNSSSLLRCKHTSNLDSLCTVDEHVGLHCLANDSGDPSNYIQLDEGNSNVTTGVIEVRVEGQWRTVCSLGFMAPAAHVACRQLGFHGAYSYNGSASNGSEEMSPFYAVICHGHESRLDDCIHYPVFPATLCKLSASVSCKNQSDYPNGLVRLFPDLSSSETSPNQGRLEIFKFDRWGQICHTSFDDSDASVACRELGYVDAESVTQITVIEGVPSYNIKRIHCTGNESRLIECPQSLDGVCTNAIRLECTNVTTPGPTGDPSLPPVPKTANNSTQIGIGVGVSFGIFLLLMVAILIALTTVMVRRCMRRRKREAEEPDWLPNTSTNIDMNFNNPRFEEPAAAPVMIMDINCKGVSQSPPPPPMECSYA